MRRKNWIKKKNYFFDKYTYNIYHFDLKKNLTFLDKHDVKFYVLTINQKTIKYSINFPEINLFFYNFLLKSVKKYNQNFLIKTYFNFYNKINDNALIIPSYTFCRQYFDYRYNFFKIIKKYHLKGFFIYKNLFESSNYSQYFYNNKLIYNNYNFYLTTNKCSYFLNKLEPIFSDKEYNNIAKIKFLYEDSTKSLIDDLNFHIFFNLSILNILEIYKINIYLYIKFLNSNK